MKNNSEEAFFYNLKLLAQCYSTGNFEELFPLLSEDITLSSMWVIKPLSGYENVKEYFVGKGNTIQKYNAFPVCSIKRSIGYPRGKLLIYMYQSYGNETAEAVVDINLNDDGKIKEINLCDKTFYQLGPIDNKNEAEEWGNWFVNHSREMSNDPNNNSLSQLMRKRRAEIFQQTINIVESGAFDSINGNHIQFPDPEIMARNTIFYKEELRINKNNYYDSMEITVLNIDCVQEGKQLKDAGFNPAILNMASGHNPGGGVIRGASAQEENLFRRSNLFQSMYQYAEFAPMYGIKKSEDQYPLDFHFGGIYTPDAFFFRGLEIDGYPLLDEPFSLSVISVPAINIRRHEMELETYMTTTKDKIRTILRIGIVHEHDALVLSAFGCGAFGNDPYVMAALFEEVFCEPEFKNSFRKIVFAIIDDHNSNGNYAAFNRIINNLL